MDDDDNVFSRWSRRKRQAVDKPERTEKVTTEVVEDLPEEDEDQILARLGLPKPETLTAGDDFRPFMAAEVPGFLRKRALRVLWRSNPVLANLDGLNDYDDDFTAPELTQKVLATAYKVGRGILRETPLEDGGTEAQEPAEAETDIVVTDVPDNPPESASTVLDSVGDVTATTQDARSEVTAEDVAFRPRRMRFE